VGLSGIIMVSELARCSTGYCCDTTLTLPRGLNLEEPVAQLVLRLLSEKGLYKGAFDGLEN